MYSSKVIYELIERECCVLQGTEMMQEHHFSQAAGNLSQSKIQNTLLYKNCVCVNIICKEIAFYN